jgi:diaminopimelate epimerase
MSGLKVNIFDPTGNITALVESPVAIEEQSAAAAQVMARFPQVEQVGFVGFPEEEGNVRLRMAGGEFCGNAAMSAAALFLLRRQSAAIGEEKTVELRVSGVSRAVEVRLKKAEGEEFLASVRMPPALSVGEQVFPFGALREAITIVRMEGIAHAIVTPGSGFFSLRGDKAAAEEAARRLCAALGAEALGLMFLEGEAPRLRLRPLVFVPGSGTMIWENSCASGSAAVGTALAERRGARVSLRLEEPGGVLEVESGGLRGKTVLTGRTRLVGEEIV